MIIIIQCKDQIGLVASISRLLSQAGLNIVSMREHVDRTALRFFMRLEVDGNGNETELTRQLIAILPQGAEVHVNPVPDKKIAVLVTREYHCLSDILVRNEFGTLGATVSCVIGNHEILKRLCERFEVPFHHVPYDNRQNAAEHEVMDLLARYAPDFIVLAKFMRILSPRFISGFPHKIINIHHSFLPAFVGANPYRKAFERGVKLIGATAHFVTDDLDEGPIIAQQIIPVNHSHTVSDMVRAGKEIETAVLAAALRLVLADRVFVYGNKTVVFE
ncbi:formyltetrahydrofolate deformylase [Pedobacter sp. JY14-1]|uniref:formyltetrahydrofolate deformylase n=1 Tax=Pedobacter sp. JY14-1 TaxID=3034151 RepID=UPI0023E2B1ED|nr:formyltetrahydrofolate deformylase [Pedobacter sp. JY14-1]